jgi:hypothetical protein
MIANAGQKGWWRMYLLQEGDQFVLQRYSERGGWVPGHFEFEELPPTVQQNLALLLPLPVEPTRLSFPQHNVKGVGTTGWNTGANLRSFVIEAPEEEIKQLATQAVDLATKEN